MINTKLQNRLPAIREYFSNQPINKAWIYGSYSRGEANANSDIDFLVQYDDSKPISLFTISKIIIDLQNLLSTKVDVVEDDCLLPFAKKSAETDKILIYERAD